MSAGEALQVAAIAALRAIEGLGVYEGPPVQASVPYALVEAGPETDWSHKSGIGREVRLAVTIRDKGERPVRLRRLMDEAEAAMAAVSGGLGDWRVVTSGFVRSRLLRPGSEGVWAGVLEYRVRLLAEPH